jgi:nitrite reductase (NO-forming)
MTLGGISEIIGSKVFAMALSVAVVTVSIAGVAVVAPDNIIAAVGEPASLHEFTLVAEEVELEIAPGERVKAWTFNGTIPGPVIRATEGDRVVLHFINNSTLPHTVHLHGDHDEKDDGVFQIVKPGETYTYDFVAEPAGAFMYHCHVMPVTQHVRMGLYGAMIIDPREPLPPAREYVLVAGEYDANDPLTNNPEHVFYNGYKDQYWGNPLPARTDELVRIYYINMGSSPAYAFHIHGTIFDAYASGIWENAPVKAQSWEVAAGNAAIFEARWPWEGRYLFHLHGLPEEKGTMGYFNVTDPDGVDFAKAESIGMAAWQEDLAERLQQGSPGVDAQPMSHHTIDIAPNDSAAPGAVVLMPEGSAVDSGKTFEPASITVNVGDIVTWRNDDAVMHTVESLEKGLFASDFLSQKKTFEHAFAKPGTYEYNCTLHPWMEGKVTVVGDDDSH